MLSGGSCVEANWGLVRFELGDAGLESLKPAGEIVNGRDREKTEGNPHPPEHADTCPAHECGKGVTGQIHERAADGETGCHPENRAI